MSDKFSEYNKLMIDLGPPLVDTLQSADPAKRQIVVGYGRSFGKTWYMQQLKEAVDFREERARREAEARQHAMSCEEKRVRQVEEDLELVMREYGHMPLSADEITEIAIDECKEMSREDFEKLRERTSIALPPGSEFVQTEASDDWFFREIEGKFDNPR
jgi:hypothetical protein